jgi:AraC-like DNA-binding protein
VAAEMGIAREQLSAWLNSRHIDYAGWLNSLRIEKAKELLTDHPEWSNEAIARECGFADRTYFQRKFKELTGRTPAEWRLQ